MELPKITFDEDNSKNQNSKFKRNQSVAVPGLLMVEKAKNFLGDQLNGGVYNVSLLSPKNKPTTGSVKLLSSRGNSDV